MVRITRATLAHLQTVLRPVGIGVLRVSSGLASLPCALPAARHMCSVRTFDNVVVDKRGEGGSVGTITLSCKNPMNPITLPLIEDITGAMQFLDKDPEVAALVLTGNEKAFAAGGDIKFMKNLTFEKCYWSFMDSWKHMSHAKKPVIAAVNGFALGRGCEMALLCDMILAGQKAIFGLPEITLGTIPGGGGTQRLVRTIGKSRAMQLCLTGNMITAQQAETWGLACSVHQPDQLLDEAIKLGEKIAKHSKLIVAMCKESVKKY